MAADSAGDVGQNYMARLVTYIPAESIGTYQALVGIIPEKHHSDALPWVAWILLAATPIWMYFATKDKGEPAAVYQVVTSVIAFAVWLVALSSPVATNLHAYPPWFGSAVLVGATAAIPLVERFFRPGARS